MITLIVLISFIITLNRKILISIIFVITLITSILNFNHFDNFNLTTLDTFKLVLMMVGQVWRVYSGNSKQMKHNEAALSLAQHSPTCYSVLTNCQAGLCESADILCYEWPLLLLFCVCNMCAQERRSILVRGTGKHVMSNYVENRPNTGKERKKIRFQFSK